jgi:RNA 3'-terminal phosphate cyclase (ATP)
MLTIDGSYGEGGGQLVRNAVALSAITGEPIAIERIRATRKNRGLAAQHIAALRSVACACDATCTGINPGSDSITFFPRGLKACDVSVDVGTAGSIPLVIQAWLSVGLISGGSLHITGGTEVSKSPTIDYLDRVLADVLRNAGAEICIDIPMRGYFPEGGGEVAIEIKKKNLIPIRPSEFQDGAPGIVSASCNLPEHVAERQAAAAAERLWTALGRACDVSIDRRSGLSTGSSCTIWRGAKGASALGKRGVPAEKIGAIAALTALEEFGQPGDVDVFLSDQLLVPLALFGGSFTTSSLTSHAETTLWLLGEFGFDVKCSTGPVVEFSA